jgi:hypothetical protein
MDPVTALGAAVNIVSIVQLSAEISIALVLYFQNVKNAPTDITRLQTQVDYTHSILTKLNALTNGPDGYRLKASTSLVKALNDCETQLQAIRKKLSVPNNQVPESSKDGLRKGVKAWFSKKAIHMKWPFTSKEIDALIANLQQITTILFQALQIDET